MSYVDDRDSIMRPKEGDSTINLPITFDYSGGRKDSNKGKIVLVIIVAVIGIIIGLGIMTSSEGFFLVNILLGLLELCIVTLIIRFPILKEHKIRENMVKLIDSDYVINYRNLWGIYGIDDEYPYYAHFRNGKSAVFVAFEKDVILGKVEEAEHEHYEAIGDAYNLAWASKIQMAYVDYMDTVGSDDRVLEKFQTLSEIENIDLRDLVTDVYTNLLEEMNENVATFDVYVFMFSTSVNTFWGNLQKVISCMLEANYLCYKILDKDELRDLSKVVFNFEDFSVNEAFTTAFEKRHYNGVIPISLVSSNGEETVFNKTLEEKKEERKLKEKEEILKKEEKKRRKAKKNKDNKKEEEFDL